MYKKHRDLAIRQYPHPPLPSFAWVMAAQANPPSPAYAYGYIRNAQAHSRPRARARAHNSNYLPARRSLPPGLHEYPPSRPHSTTRLPPSPTKAKTTPILAAEHSSDKFMETVDYRYDDPPSRPCVPWLEGYTSIPRRGASSSRQRQQQQEEVLPYKDDSTEELVLPHFSTAESPPPTVSPASATCRFVGEDSGSDDTPPKKKMKRTRLRSRSRAGKSVDVVKIKPLDIVLGALRRACGLSAKEGPCKPSP